MINSHFACQAAAGWPGQRGDVWVAGSGGFADGPGQGGQLQQVTVDHTYQTDDTSAHDNRINTGSARPGTQNLSENVRKSMVIH